MKPRLPRIIRFDGRTDSGEFGAANCPHCDAKGRYIYHFFCEDGQRRGAMAGCIKLYPVSFIASEHKALIEKAQEKSRNGETLNSWDTAKLNAIQKFYDGEISEDDAEMLITAENCKRNAWIKRRYRR